MMDEKNDEIVCIIRICLHLIGEKYRKQRVNPWRPHGEVDSLTVLVAEAEHMF